MTDSKCGSNRRNVGAGRVVGAAESPIEKTFLNSLILSFIKNDGLGLLVHPTFKDTVSEIAEFRTNLAHWHEFFAWFRANKPAATLDEFLDGEVRRGVMGEEGRR